jgi:hypothetical protein
MLPDPWSARSAPAGGKLAEFRAAAPHLAVVGGVEEIGMPLVADDPEVDPFLDVVGSPRIQLDRLAGLSKV